MRHHQARDSRRGALPRLAQRCAKPVVQLAALVDSKTGKRVGKDHSEPQPEQRTECEGAQRAHRAEKASFSVGRADRRAELATALGARPENCPEYAPIAYLDPQQEIAQPVLTISCQRDQKLAIAVFQPVVENLGIRKRPVVLRRLDPQVLRQAPVILTETIDPKPDALEAVLPRQLHKLLQQEIDCHRPVQQIYIKIESLGLTQFRPV